MAEKINPIALYALMTSMVLSASTLGIILKIMDTTESKGHPFEHPFFQCLIMFAGEACCIFIYLYQRYTLVRDYGSIQASPGMQNAVKEGMKTDINPLLFAIPMLCDSGASALLLIGYINLPASITQMMGGFVVFIVAIMSIIFLKRKLYRHHWTGLGLLFIGIGFVALSVLVAGKTNNPNENPMLGIPLMIVSILIQGCQFIVEEKLLGSYYLNPMKVVGWEGITGCILWCILLPILQFISCDIAICSPTHVVEDTRYAFEQMAEEPILIVYVLANVVLVGGMNGLGMAVTKYASAANRVTLQQTKVIIIWLFFLIVPIRGKEEFRILQLVGFILLLCGVVLFNEIIELPIFGFNKFTKKALEKSKLRAKSLNYDETTDNQDESDSNNFTNDATNYTPSSPSRYDYQRNYKRVQDRMETKAGKDTKGDYMKMEGME